MEMMKLVIIPIGGSAEVVNIYFVACILLLNLSPRAIGDALLLLSYSW